MKRTRSWGRRTGGLCLVLFAAGIVSGVPAAAPEEKPSGAAALRVLGAVLHPLSLTLPQLRGMPATEPRWERDGMAHTAKGADVMTLVERAGLKADRAVKNQSLRFAVIARGRDGYEAVFSLGELSPKLGGKGAVVAYEQDGQPLPEREGPLKLVAPGDQAPSRWVRDLVALSIVNLDTTHQPNAPNHLAP